MKKLFFAISAIVFLSFASTKGIVFHTNKFADVANCLIDHVADGTPTSDVVIVCDIDDTLATNGADAWFYKRIGLYQSEELSFQDAINMTLPHYTDMQYNTPLRLIENNTPSTVKLLQQNGHPVIGLTSRSFFLGPRTAEQLGLIGISLSFNGTKNDIPLEIPESKEHCIYNYGIIFSGNNHKGIALLTFFDRFEVQPALVVFIDDKQKYVDQVETALERNGIECVGIVYSGAKDIPQSACTCTA